jgi:hypothetical protein
MFSCAFFLSSTQSASIDDKWQHDMYDEVEQSEPKGESGGTLCMLPVWAYVAFAFQNPILLSKRQTLS